MSTSTNTETVVAAFHTPGDAQAAIRRLKEAGFTDEQIGVVSQGDGGEVTHGEDGARALDDSASEASGGAAVGAATGLGVGALWGLGIVGGMLPAIGPVIAGGALAAIAASAAGTAAVGGVIGALVGMGVSDEEAEYYQHQFESGRTLVTVRTGHERHDEVRGLLDGFNAYDYERRESDYAINPSAEKRMNANGEWVTR